MAKPATINRSRIRRDCASLSGVPVAGSPHRRLRSSFFGTRRSQSEICENGKQGGGRWIVRVTMKLVLQGKADGTRGRSVRSLMSTKGLRTLRPRCGLAFMARSRGADASASLESVVTWLILPVVICLSQRLSHACLSINKFVL
jgi:hypothetical protein